LSPDTTQPTAAVNPDDIRAQLKRLLEHNIFRSSRRCARLLEHLVEYKLQGEVTSPKERTLGIEVFDREPDYDTANDPVVRSAANEIRKRIAQYYHKHGLEDEIRFELPTGSYLLEFHLPEKATAPQVIQSLPKHKRRISSLYVSVGAAVLILGVIGFMMLRTPTALDRFWGPVLNSKNRLLICMNSTSTIEPVRNDKAKGRPELDPAHAGLEILLGMPFVGLTDNQGLVTVIRFLTTQKTNFEVQYHKLNETLPDDYIRPSLDELRKGPTVFIGGSDWTYRILPSLRFHNNIDADTGIMYIEDAQNPSNKKWGIRQDQSFLDYTEDYAFITRLADNMTGQVLVFISGMGLHGTGAACEFVTNSDMMNEVASGSSPEWKNKNVQIVISTKVAGRAWGTSQLLAKHFW
jgi:hypothetical protein